MLIFGLVFHCWVHLTLGFNVIWLYGYLVIGVGSVVLHWFWILFFFNFLFSGDDFLPDWIFEIIYFIWMFIFSLLFFQYILSLPTIILSSWRFRVLFPWFLKLILFSATFLRNTAFLHHFLAHKRIHELRIFHHLLHEVVHHLKLFWRSSFVCWWHALMRLVKVGGHELICIKRK